MPLQTAHVSFHTTDRNARSQLTRVNHHTATNHSACDVPTGCLKPAQSANSPRCIYAALPPAMPDWRTVEQFRAPHHYRNPLPANVPTHLQIQTKQASICSLGQTYTHNPAIICIHPICPRTQHVRESVVSHITPDFIRPASEIALQRRYAAPSQTPESVRKQS